MRDTRYDIVVLAVAVFLIWWFFLRSVDTSKRIEGIDVLNILPPDFASSGQVEAASIIGESGIRNTRSNNERTIQRSIVQRT